MVERYIYFTPDRHFIILIIPELFLSFRKGEFLKLPVIESTSTFAGKKRMVFITSNAQILFASGLLF